MPVSISNDLNEFRDAHNDVQKQAKHSMRKAMSIPNATDVDAFDKLLYDLGFNTKVSTETFKTGVSYTKITYSDSVLLPGAKIIAVEIGMDNYIVRVSYKSQSYVVDDFSGYVSYATFFNDFKDKLCKWSGYSSYDDMMQINNMVDTSEVELKVIPTNEETKPDGRIEREYIYEDYLIAVYGSLRKGGALHSHLEDSTYIKRIVTNGFAMFDKNGAYPLMIRTGNPSDNVVLELYRVSWKTLQKLDDIEEDGLEYTRYLIPDTDIMIYLATDIDNTMNTYPQVPLLEEHGAADWLKYVEMTYPDKKVETTIDSNGNLNIIAEQ